MKIQNARLMLRATAEKQEQIHKPKDELLDQFIKRVYLEPHVAVYVMDAFSQMEGLSQADRDILPMVLQDALVADRLLEPNGKRKTFGSLKPQDRFSRLTQDALEGFNARQSAYLNAKRIAFMEYGLESDEYRRLDKIHYALAKFAFMHHIAGKTMADFIAHPYKNPGANIHIRAGVNAATKMGVLAAMPASLRHVDDPLTRDTMKFYSGLMQEIDVYLGLGNFFQMRRSGTWVIPTAWQMDHGLKTPDGFSPGVDLLIVRPTTEEIWGVQTGLTKNRQTQEGVITIDASDISNIEGNRITSGNVLGALSVSHGGPDNRTTRFVMGEASFVDMSTPIQRPRKPSEGKDYMRGIRNDIEKIFAKQAPELLEDTA
jgi:hypothetical protein